MGGHGTFTESRTGVNVTNGTDDLVTDKLPALQAYQLTLAAPPPAAGSFDADAAARGKTVFEGQGKCATCHSGALFTDANSNAARSERGGQRARAERRAQLRVAQRDQEVPDRAAGGRLAAPALLPQRQRGDARRRGRHSTTRKKSLGLTAAQAADLVQYLKSL